LGAEIEGDAHSFLSAILHALHTNDETHISDADRQEGPVYPARPQIMAVFGATCRTHYECGHCSVMTEAMDEIMWLEIKADGFDNVEAAVENHFRDEVTTEKCSTNPM
jgi:hypothetical protein